MNIKRAKNERNGFKKVKNERKKITQTTDKINPHSCVPEHVNAEIMRLDKGGSTLGAKMILRQFNSDMSMQNVRI